MIVVSVQLWSAVTGQKSELARMEICNDGTGTKTLRNYDARTLRGRDTKALNHRIGQRGTHVAKWPAERMHIWNLVATCLRRMSYGATPAGGDTDDLLETTPPEEAAE